MYRHHFVSRYDSLAQYEEVANQLFSEEVYTAWFNTASDEGLFDWESAETKLYRVFD